MKPHERRQAGAYPYFKLATWQPRSFTFFDGKRALKSEAACHDEAKGLGPGKYRISVVTADGRQDLDPFTVGG